MPETLGIGVDLCAVSRIERAIQKAHFLNRVFTEAERAYLQGRGRGAGESAAAMFAAKEAVAKALGTGFGSLAPADVEITHDASGAPAYLINEKTRSALQARGAQSAFLSVTHDGDYAMATAILEG